MDVNGGVLPGNVDDPRFVAGAEDAPVTAAPDVESTPWWAEFAMHTAEAFGQVLQRVTEAVFHTLAHR
jgi:hypothetical protein